MLCFGNLDSGDVFGMYYRPALDHHIETVFTRERSVVSAKCFFKKAIARRLALAADPVGTCG